METAFITKFITDNQLNIFMLAILVFVGKLLYDHREQIKDMTAR